MLGNFAIAGRAPGRILAASSSLPEIDPKRPDGGAEPLAGMVR